MKWFRHNSDSHSNIKMLILISEYGMEGFGVFWTCCELIANQGEKYKIEGKKKWGQVLCLMTHIRKERLQLILRCMGENDLIDNAELKKGNLSIPKMADYSDEYTVRKSGGQVMYYGKNWLKQKKLARARDGYVCRVCGKTTEENKRSLEVHHIKPAKAFSKFNESGQVTSIDWNEANKLENLITVCISCHGTLKSRSGMEWNESSTNPEHPTLHNITLHNNTEDNAPAAPFVWEEYLKEMDNDPRIHVQLIAYFFRRRGLKFNNKAEVQIAIRRHLRAATQVAKFDKQKVFNAMDECDQMARQKGIRWTVDTCLKLLTK